MWVWSVSGQKYVLDVCAFWSSVLVDKFEWVLTLFKGIVLDYLIIHTFHIAFHWELKSEKNCNFSNGEKLKRGLEEERYFFEKCWF